MINDNYEPKHIMGQPMTQMIVQAIDKLKSKDFTNWLAYVSGMFNRHQKKKKRGITAQEAQEFFVRGFVWIQGDHLCDKLISACQGDDGLLKLTASLRTELERRRDAGDCDYIDEHDMKRALFPILKRQYESQVLNIRHRLSEKGIDMIPILKERKELDEKWQAIRKHLGLE